MSEDGSKVARWGGRWGLIVFLWVAFALAYMARQSLYSIFPVLRAELGFTEMQLALTTTVFGWVYGVANAFGGGGGGPGVQTAVDRREPAVLGRGAGADGVGVDAGVAAGGAFADGPGVSSPMAAISSIATPYLSRAIFRPFSICRRHTSGPCRERAGCAHRPSIRNFDSSSRSV